MYREKKPAPFHRTRRAPQLPDSAIGAARRGQWGRGRAANGKLPLPHDGGMWPIAASAKERNRADEMGTRGDGVRVRISVARAPSGRLVRGLCFIYLPIVAR